MVEGEQYAVKPEKNLHYPVIIWWYKGVFFQSPLDWVSKVVNELIITITMYKMRLMYTVHCIRV